MALRELILHNFWLKLFSFLLAVLVWFAVYVVREGDFNAQTFVTSPDSRTLSHIPVALLKNADDDRLFEVSPRAVTVIVTGEAAILRELSRDEIKVYIDLSGDPRKTPSQDEKVRIHAPANITIVNALPLAVQIRLLNKEQNERPKENIRN